MSAMRGPLDLQQRLTGFWHRIGLSGQRMVMAGLPLLAIAVAWHAVYSPLLTAVAVRRAELAQLKGQIADAHLLAGQAAQQQAALDEAQAAFHRVRRRVGEGQTVASALEELGRQAKQHRLELVAIQPEEQEAPRLLAVEGGLTVREVPVRLRVKGRYQQLGQFLAALSTASCLASVQRLDLARPNSDSPQLQAEMVLAVYLEEPGSI